MKPVDRMKLTKTEKICFPELLVAMRRHRKIGQAFPSGLGAYTAAEAAAQLDRVLGVVAK